MNSVEGRYWRTERRMAFQIKIILVLWLIIALWGCRLQGAHQFPQTGASLYPEVPGQCSIPGSTGQAIVSRNMPVTFDELFDVTYKAAFRKGLEVDYKDKKTGRLIGKGIWQYISRQGPAKLTIVFAAYIEEVDQKPTTKLTIVMDCMNIGTMGQASNMMNQFANDFVIDVQKLLATMQ